MGQSPPTLRKASQGHLSTSPSSKRTVFSLPDTDSTSKLTLHQSLHITSITETTQETARKPKPGFLTYMKYFILSYKHLFIPIKVVLRG